MTDLHGCCSPPPHCRPTKMSCILSQAPIKSSTANHTDPIGQGFPSPCKVPSSYKTLAIILFALRDILDLLGERVRRISCSGSKTVTEDSSRGTLSGLRGKVCFVGTGFKVIEITETGALLQHYWQETLDCSWNSILHYEQWKQICDWKSIWVQCPLRNTPRPSQNPQTSWEGISGNE